VPYSIGNAVFHTMFKTTDGIYPNYSRFVHSLADPETMEERLYTDWQESTRKDIERGFGVLQGKFQFMTKPIHLFELTMIASRVQTCLILHNMGVSDRVMVTITAQYNPSHLRQDALPETIDETGISVDNHSHERMDGGTMNSIHNRWNQLTDEKEHVRLYKALLSTFS